MNLRIDHEAFEELAQASDNYESQKTGLGVQFLDVVNESFDNIKNDPRLFPLHPKSRLSSELRYATLRKFPYVIIYRVQLTEVLVVSVTHERRNPTHWLKRIP